jgi:LmbE family N-acetylglucosaminyl deacetylase
MNLNETTLVIAAHPDDEILGCGATLARIASEGGKVQTLFLSDGESSRFDHDNLNSDEFKQKLLRRRESAEAAAKLIGSLPPKFLDFPDNQLDTVPLLAITRLIENEILLLNPKRVITHSNADLNIDHRIAHEATLIATRPQGLCEVIELLAFELPSSTEWRPPGSGQNFIPNYFVDVTYFEEVKSQALQCYAIELRDFPHPRSQESISALMKWRGSNSNCSSAEAFLLLRGIY